MHIRFAIDVRHARRWQTEAIAALVDGPGRCGSIAPVASSALPARLAALLALEDRLYRLPPDHPLASSPVAGLPAASPDDRPDLVVDLQSATPPPGGLAVAVGGAPVVAGAVAAVVAGDNPVLELLYGSADGPKVLGRWRIGVETADVAGKAIGPTLGRAVEMLALAVDEIAAGRPAADVRLPCVAPSPAAAPADPLVFAVRSLVAKIRRRLPGAPAAPRWHVAWRADMSGDGVLPDLDAAPFQLLPDDGRRFYADPFVIRRDGRTVLFVEDFPFATGRGVIAAVELAGDGPVGRPQTVLALDDCHLSYPFLFEEAGDLFMVPETSERRTVELWRCRRFPDAWEREATLLADVDIGDATLLKRDDGWLMLGARRPRWGSSWDGLCLYAAPALTGPWWPIGNGPAKVDVATARPAGRILHIDGGLVRPFQDSAGGYGAGLGFAAIDRFDDGGISERVIALRRARPPLHGIHTYNRGHGFEVIDVFAADPPSEIAP